MYSYCMHWTSVNSVAHGASALWGVRCTLPYQQPVLLCFCLACVYNISYVCMSSVTCKLECWNRNAALQRYF